MLNFANDPDFPGLVIATRGSARGRLFQRRATTPGEIYILSLSIKARTMTVARTRQSSAQMVFQ